jgi:hypothetical protein
MAVSHQQVVVAYSPYPGAIWHGFGPGTQCSLQLGDAAEAAAIEARLLARIAQEVEMCVVEGRGDHRALRVDHSGRGIDKRAHRVVRAAP